MVSRTDNHYSWEQMFYKHSRHDAALWLVFLCFVFLPATNELQAQTPKSTSFIGLRVSSRDLPQFSSFQREQSASFTTDGYYPGSIFKYSRIVSSEVEMESTEGFIMIRQLALKKAILPPVALTFENYTNYLYDQQLKNSWAEYASKNYTYLTEKKGSGGLTFEVPVRIKNKAFRKIFGSGSVGLVVTGNISIKAGLRREDRSETKTVITQGSNTNFKMDQTQRFSVTGKIGDKVKVNVDQDSERAFDFDNNVRLVYDGYDDEVVKKFEAGNISLSLPGTRYVTFSGKNTGLFGLKTEMALGSLNLTAIASQEKGESQKLSLEGGASSGGNRVDDYNYTKNQYFFLDEVYRLSYRYFTEDGRHVTSIDPATGDRNGIKQDRIQVYLLNPRNKDKYPDKIISGQATATGVVDPDNFAPEPGFANEGPFVRLEPAEYYVENELGFIRLNSPLSEDEALAVAYETIDGRIFGDLDFVRAANDSTKIRLKLIHDSGQPQPEHKTWNLTWRHVYYMGSSDVKEDGLEVQMFNKPASGEPSAVSQSGKNWLTVFGLDTKDENGNPTPDSKFDVDPAIFLAGSGEIHFRDLTPFAPQGYYILPNNNYPASHDDADLPPPITWLDQVTDADGVGAIPEIYEATDASIIRGKSTFYLDIKTQNRSANYDLGFNVIDGSEVVTLNGSILQKGSDYTIDYFSGQLTLLNEAATDPSAKLDVTYERNQLFQLEKKTIMGVRAEYDLGGNSFIGGTFLYLNESTLDEKVRVGKGPMRNVVWDLNTRLQFKPNFIGRTLDALPIVRAQGETTFDFEAEVAQVLPNPNTLNNEKTNDNNGVAYVDDFEAAKKAITLSVLRKGWDMASPPVVSQTAENLGLIKHDHSNKVNNFIWYNPGQVSLKQIFPERDVSSGGVTGGTNFTHVLQFDFFENPNNIIDGATKSASRWGGVMRALSSGFNDQTQTKFIEIMVQGDVGRLHVDLGTISEDIIPNGKKNLEDQDTLENGLYDGPEEDTGLDGVIKPDPPVFNFPRTEHVGKTIAEVPFDFWDVNDNGLKDADEPWSYDDYFYPAQSLSFITQGSGSINGTENNRNDEGGRITDTEDLDGNTLLDRRNDYFSFSFSLRDDHPDYREFFVEGSGNPRAAGGAWKLYRIPFNPQDVDYVVGNPSTSQIENVRIWFDELEYNRQSANDLPNRTRVTIAEINMVGSEWKEVGVTGNEYNLETNVKTEGASRETFSITQINTHENPAYAATLDAIGVRGEIDRVTKVEAREQSLVLAFNNLAIGESGVAEKSLFQGETYINYDRIKMFVYGDTSLNADNHITIDEQGNGYSNVEYFVRFGANRDNYYEYRAPLFVGWDQVRRRNEMDIRLLDFTSIARSAADTTRSDTTVGGVFYDAENDIYRRNLEGGKQVAVKGDPSFSNIRTLILGIKNKTRVDKTPNNFDPKPFTGDIWFNELRLSNIEKAPGTAIRASGNLRIGKLGGVNAEIEKKDADFHNVAQRYGSGGNANNRSLNASLNVDQVLPQFLGIAMPVSFTTSVRQSYPKYFPGRDRRVTKADLDSTELLQRIQSTSEKTGFSVRLNRREKSKNFFIKNTIDGMSFSLSNTKSSQKSPTLAFSTSEAWSGNFDYKLDFGRDNFISPFIWLPDLPIVRNAKKTKLYYTPQNISLRADGSKTSNAQSNRIQGSLQNSDTTTTKNFTANRTFRTSMKVFESLTLDFNRAHKSQLRDNQTLSAFFKFDNDIGVTQSFSARYRPEIISWIPTNGSYSSNYRFTNTIQNRETGRSANNSVTFSTDATIKWKDMAKALFGKKKKRGTRPKQSSGRKNPPGEKMEFNFFQEKPAPKGISIDPMKLVSGFFSSFKDLRVDFKQTTNVTQSGLDTLGGMPGWGFQFGLSDTTGLASVANLSGNPVSTSDNENLSFSSGLAFGRSFDVTLRFDKSNRSSFSNQRSGSESNSFASEFGLNMPFPDWTVRLSGLEKLPLVSRFFRTITFSHAYTGSKDRAWTASANNLTSENISSNFRPFGKLDLSMKNGLSGNIAVNKSTTLNKSLSSGSGASRSTNFDVSATANFSKKSGFSLPFMKGKKLKNSIDFSFTFTASSAVQESTRSSDLTGFEETSRTTRWSLSPRLSYSFSSTVTGGAFVDIGKTNNKRVGTTKYQEFGVDVNIAIRGK